jgi:quercetin dioxygenase-like cupin family protein
MKQQFFVKLILSFISVILLSMVACNAWTRTLSDIPSDLSSAPLSSSPLSSVQQQVQRVLPHELQWQDNPDIVGVQSAVAVGDSSNSELYVLFGKMKGGVTFPAHTHPDDRITTVISGIMYYGVGERADRANTQPYPAGSVVYTPAGVSHFMWVQDGETVMQETGLEPTGLEFTTNAS